MGGGGLEPYEPHESEASRMALKSCKDELHELLTYIKGGQAAGNCLAASMDPPCGFGVLRGPCGWGGQLLRCAQTWSAVDLLGHWRPVACTKSKPVTISHT